MKTKKYCYAVRLKGTESQIDRLPFSSYSKGSDYHFLDFMEAKRFLRDYITKNVNQWLMAQKRVIAMDARQWDVANSHDIFI